MLRISIVAQLLSVNHLTPIGVELVGRVMKEIIMFIVIHTLRATLTTMAIRAQLFGILIRTCQ